MINAVLYKASVGYTGFELTGHAEYADEGSDIVCAAVSAVTQTLAIQAENVLEMPNAVFTDEDKALLKVIGESSDAWNSSLTAAEIYLSEVSKLYPRNLTTRITEV